jgi:transposase-like protein
MVYGTRLAINEANWTRLAINEGNGTRFAINASNATQSRVRPMVTASIKQSVAALYSRPSGFKSSAS